MNRSRFIFNPIMQGLLTGLLIGSVSVHSADYDALYDLDFEQLLEVEIQVATRTNSTLESSPSTVTVFTDQEIRRMGIQSLEHLLNYVSGFQSSRSDDDGRTYMPRVRGRRGGSTGFDVLVLLDGLRLNDIIDGGAFIQDSNINLDNLKQVEIIRGPGSALYGSNAFAAVVNLVSKDVGNTAQVSTGSFNGRKGRLSWSKRVWGLDWSVYGRYYQDEGEYYPPFHNFLGLFIPLTDGTKHNDVYIRGGSEQWEVYLRKSTRIYSDFLISGSMAEHGQRMKHDNRSARVVYHYQPSDDFKLSPYADYVDADSDALLSIFPAEPNVTPNFNWSNGAKVANMGGNIRTTHHKRIGFDGQWSWSQAHQLIFGALWRQESVGLNPFQGNWDAERLLNENIFVPSENGAINQGFWINGVKFDLFTPQQRDVSGYYLQDQWYINDSMTFTSGLRYDKYDDFGGNLSLRGGLVYQLNAQRTFKLLYGEAFRAPTFTESRAGIASGGLSNPDLKPETIKTYELGWFENHDWGRLSATYYENKISDTIVNVRIDDTVTGISATQPHNLYDVDISGVEFEADIKLSPQWLLKAGFSHIIKEKSHEPVAKNSAFVILNYGATVANKPLNLNLNGYYHDKVWYRQADGEASSQDRYLGSYWRWNLTAHYSLTEQWQLSVSIDNLFDKAFTTYTRQLSNENGLPNRGRSWLASIEYKF